MEEKVQQGGYTLAKVVSDARAENENTLVLDNGDTIQGNYNHLFLTEEYLNSNINPMVLALTEIGYDSMTLGNHEFNYGMNILDIIKNQLETGGTNVLCANLYKDGERVFDPYIIKEYDGIRVAVIGVVTNHITKWDADKLVGYTPTNPALEVQKVIKEIKDKDLADLYVVSSHVGVEEEYGDGDGASTIAELNPEVSLIIAGHSHQSVVSQYVNGVLITQPKNAGQAVAKVELEVEKTADGVNVVNKEVSHVSLSATSNLYPGDITKVGLANIYKFDNKLYTVKTTGKQIKKYLEWTAQFYNTFKDGDLNVSFDSNFASFKYDMLSGITYEVNISKEVGQRVENIKFNDGKTMEDSDIVYLAVNDYRYSSNLAPIFDEGEHEKIYESTNDSLSDVRDMIADYIVNVKGGVVERKVDNNWTLTGVKYNEALRNEVVKLINDGTIKLEISYGIAAASLTFEDVERQLTEAGLTEKLEELRKLNEAGSSEEKEPSKEPGEGSEGIVEEEKNESSDKKDDTIVVEGNKNPEANKGDKLPNTGAEISFAIVLAGALALVGAGLALINEKKKIS